MRQLTVFRG